MAEQWSSSRLIIAFVWYICAWRRSKLSTQQQRRIHSSQWLSLHRRAYHLLFHLGNCVQRVDCRFTTLSLSGLQNDRRWCRDSMKCQQEIRQTDDESQLPLVSILVFSNSFIVKWKVAGGFFNRRFAYYQRHAKVIVISWTDNAKTRK